MLDLLVPLIVVCYEMSPLPITSPGETDEFIGIAPGPPRLEAALKFSIPVMCILSVPGLGATIWPFMPLMTDPLLPAMLLVKKWLTWRIWLGCSNMLLRSWSSFLTSLDIKRGHWTYRTVLSLVVRAPARLYELALEVGVSEFLTVWRDSRLRGVNRSLNWCDQATKFFLYFWLAYIVEVSVS